MLTGGRVGGRVGGHVGARAGVRAGSVLLVAALASGCQFLPIGEPAIEVECVDLPQAACDRESARLIEEASRAGKRIVSIRLTERDGGEVLYDDGTGMAWTP